MHIALISPLTESVPPRFYGGTERVVYNLCRGLVEADHEVTLFASGDSSVDSRLVSAIPEALRLAQIPVNDPVPYYLRMLAQVAQQADEFDIIHNHHDYWMLPLTEMTQTPVVTTLHGRLDLPDLPAAFLSYPNHHFISISDAQRKPLSSLNWIRTIHHGINVSDFEFHPKPGNYLAFLGRISWDKRPDLAIEIAKRSGVPLKIAAKIEGRESQEYFDSYIKPHVDGKFIEYLGEISDAEKCEFLGRALALVFPIDWPEPFGLVVIESLACGTPVLARPLGSMPELLSEGITGYSSLNIGILIEHVKDLARLDRSRCRQWVETHFSLERMTEVYIDVYRQLAESAGSRRTARRNRGTVSYRRDLVHTL